MSSEESDFETLSTIGDTAEDIENLYANFKLSSIDVDKWKLSADIVLINVLQRIEEKLDILLCKNL